MKQLAIGIRLLLGSFLIAFSSYAVASPYTFTTIDVPVPNAIQTIATGIDNAGHIVGFYTADGTHGFVLSDGNFSDINFPGSISTNASGISQSGKDIVGTYSNVCCTSHAFVLSAGTFSAIDPPGAIFGSRAFGINSQGVVIGDYIDAFRRYGFIFRKGVFTTLNFPGSSQTYTFGINNAGKIVGAYEAEAKLHGYLFENDIFSAIDLPGATATVPMGINAAGQIVGVVHFPNDIHGFVLINGAVTLIDFPGATKTEALGINSKGQIVGNYQDAAGKFHGFLATPGVMISPFSGP